MVQLQLPEFLAVAASALLVDWDAIVGRYVCSDLSPQEALAVLENDTYAALARNRWLGPCDVFVRATKGEDGLVLVRVFDLKRETVP